MQYRKVPKNGDQLSALGYGCMRFPGRMQAINEKLAESQMMSALEQGVNYFDTAWPYHNGRSEPFVGKVFARDGRRDRVKLATKLPHWLTRSREAMDKILDQQLERLRTDRIDYYLVHGLNGNAWDRAKDHGVIEFLQDSLQSGKIINAGFSFHGLAEDFKRIIDDYDWTFCQIQYNYLDTESQAGTAGLKYAAAKDLAVIIMEPLRGGNLAKPPPPSVQAVWDRADQKRTPVGWSLGWIWNHPEVTVVLSGMNAQEQIDENLKLAENSAPGSLTPEELDLVEQAAREFMKVMRVGCTGCQYCMPCPAGVNIPSCFAQYNSRHAFSDRMAKVMYIIQNGGVFGEKRSFASECVKCGECEEKCPQGIPIRAKLEEVSADLEGWMTDPLIWVARRMMKVKKR